MQDVTLSPPTQIQLFRQGFFEKGATDPLFSKDGPDQKITNKPNNTGDAQGKSGWHLSPAKSGVGAAGVWTGGIAPAKSVWKNDIG